MEKEDYFFDTKSDYKTTGNAFALIIYDISDTKKRNQLVKLLSGYGYRVQKSAFEALINEKKYRKLIAELPKFSGNGDSIRV